MRLTYDAGGAVSGTVGAYLWDSEYDIRLRSFIGFAVPNVILDLPQFTRQETDSWALFFEGDISLSDQWTLTLGGRYTEDEKSTDQTGIVTAGADDSWNEFTPRVGLRYQLNDDVMLYGTYSVGYRSGGFNVSLQTIDLGDRKGLPARSRGQRRRRQNKIAGGDIGAAAIGVTESTVTVLLSTKVTDAQTYFVSELIIVPCFLGRVNQECGHRAHCGRGAQ